MEIKVFLSTCLVSTLIFLFISCSNFNISFIKRKNEIIWKNNTYYYSELDYVKHLESLGQDYIRDKNIIKFQIKGEQKRYLNSIFEQIVKNNELLIKNPKIPQFYIVKDVAPWHFSIPNGKIFVSSGLVKRYLNFEGILIAILSYEIIKSYRNLFPKKIIVPLEYINSERMLSMTRIHIRDKLELNNWIFLVLKRSGYDPYVYLMWIQTQNKNTIDFLTHLGDIKNIAKEEYNYKILMNKSGLNNDITNIVRNSSPSFYRFISDFKKLNL